MSVGAEALANAAAPFHQLKGSGAGVESRGEREQLFVCGREIRAARQQVQQGIVVRITEVLAGARTGRTCYRSSPSITIGRAGCDLNFPSDPLLAPRHVEIRIGEDGSAMLVDASEDGSGVFLRVRAQQPVELQAGDVVRVGQQQLRLEIT